MRHQMSAMERSIEGQEQTGKTNPVRARDRRDSNVAEKQTRRKDTETTGSSVRALVDLATSLKSLVKAHHPHDSDHFTVSAADFRDMVAAKVAAMKRYNSTIESVTEAKLDAFLKIQEPTIETGDPNKVKNITDTDTKGGVIDFVPVANKAPKTSELGAIQKLAAEYETKANEEAAARVAAEHHALVDEETLCWTERMLAEERWALADAEERANREAVARIAAEAKAKADEEDLCWAEKTLEEVTENLASAKAEIAEKENALCLANGKLKVEAIALATMEVMKKEEEMISHQAQYLIQSEAVSLAAAESKVRRAERALSQAREIAKFQAMALAIAKRGIRKKDEETRNACKVLDVESVALAAANAKIKANEKALCRAHQQVEIEAVALAAAEIALRSAKLKLQKAEAKASEEHDERQKIQGDYAELKNKAEKFQSALQEAEMKHNANTAGGRKIKGINLHV